MAATIYSAIISRNNSRFQNKNEVTLKKRRVKISTKKGENCKYTGEKREKSPKKSILMQRTYI